MYHLKPRITKSSGLNRRHFFFPLAFLFAVFCIGSRDPCLQSKSGFHFATTSLTRLLLPLVTIKNKAMEHVNRWQHSNAIASTAQSTKRLDNQLTTRDVTVQLFQWRYSDISRECEQYLGPIGYRYVQISPPHEHIEGPQWWTTYQPVSYRVGSKLGSEAEFDQMVDRCTTAGVGVIVDVVMNHMSAGSSVEDRIGTLGSSYRKYDYPTLYNQRNFHRCRRRGSLEINNYMDRYEVQNCELVGLADLKTGQSQVQAQLRSYLQRLIAKGVSGIRVDAAKHIPANDLKKILKEVSIRVVQEVIFVGGEPIRPEEYMPTGRVHVFQAAYDLKRMFESDGIAYLGQPIRWGHHWGNGYLPSSHSQIFVTNWDLERNRGALRIDQDQAIYILSQIFILTWDYGQVDVFSGYNFTNFDDGPQQENAECNRHGWRCEHRHPAVVGAVRLRAAAFGQPVQNVITSGAQRLAFGRGDIVFVALNNEDTPWNLDGVAIGLPIPLPDKPYHNILHKTGSEEIIQVQKDHSTGRAMLFSVIIPARSAMGIMV